MNPDLIIGLTIAAAAVAWAWHLHRREQQLDAHIDQAIALTRPAGTQPPSEFNCTANVHDRELAAALEDWGRDVS